MSFRNLHPRKIPQGPFVRQRYVLYNNVLSSHHITVDFVCRTYPPLIPAWKLVKDFQGLSGVIYVLVDSRP
jgi:hypothetical protein